MNNEQMQQRIEKDLPKLEARIAVVENRVDDLEKKQGTIDIVEQRVNKVETNIGMITEKINDLNNKLDDSTKQMSIDIKAITDKVDMFSDNMGKEFNRLIRWVGTTIVLSLVSGIIIMFVYQGNMFKGIGENMGNLERCVSEKITTVEKDIIRLEVKVDTTGRKE